MFHAAFSRFARRLAAGAVALSLALSLAGCGRSLNSFTWQVEHVPENLDPQLASESPEVIAVTHLFSGLFRRDENGTPQPECAESYECSADGKTYTFHLKDGLVWHTYKDQDTSTPVTAADFVFGLQRTLRPETQSPWAENFTTIRNAQAILDGRMDASQLGVSAPDDHTLVIQLEAADSNLPAKLCLPGAMPCNEAFFQSTGGTYGLGSKTVLANGSFYLYNWTEGGLFLRRAANGSLINSLRLVTADTVSSSSSSSDSQSAAASVDAAQQVASGKADAAFYTGTGDVGSLSQTQYAATTWVLAYNCSVPGLSNTAVRAGLSGIAQSVSLELSDLRQPATGLIPPVVQLNGSGYRETVGNALAAPSDPRQSYRDGLAEAGLTKLGSVTILVPEGESQLVGQINQAWQKELSAFFSVKELPLADLQRQVADGDYQIALLPLTPSENSPLSLLSQFASGGFSGFSDNNYDAQLAQIQADAAHGGSAERYAQLERMLLAQAPITPLFFQADRLVMVSGIQGLVFDPFIPSVDVTFATKK